MESIKNLAADAGAGIGSLVTGVQTQIKQAQEGAAAARDEAAQAVRIRAGATKKKEGERASWRRAARQPPPPRRNADEKKKRETTTTTTTTTTAARSLNPKTKIQNKTVPGPGHRGVEAGARGPRRGVAGAARLAA